MAITGIEISMSIVIFILVHIIIYKFLYKKKHYGLFWIMLFTLSFVGIDLLNLNTNPQNTLLAFVYIIIMIILMIINFLKWKGRNV